MLTSGGDFESSPIDTVCIGHAINLWRWRGVAAAVAVLRRRVQVAGGGGARGGPWRAALGGRRGGAARFTLAAARQRVGALA